MCITSIYDLKLNSKFSSFLFRVHFPWCLPFIFFMILFFIRSIFHLIFDRKCEIKLVFIYLFLRILLTLWIISYNLLEIVRTQKTLSGFFCQNSPSLVIIFVCTPLFQKCKVIASNSNIVFDIRQSLAFHSFLSETALIFYPIKFLK